jgi:protein phosphatase
MVGEMLRAGVITAEEAFTHPNKNILTRALGTDIKLDVDTGSINISEGVKTALLICSDGLSDMLTDESILEIMNRDITADEKGDILLEKALENGGRDNISLIIIN